MEQHSLKKEVEQVAQGDAAALMKAEKSYGHSWKQRGGVGAFMMLARKWDRLEKRVGELPVFHEDTQAHFEGDRFDIFAHIEADDRSEGVIDDIRDLRRYLNLVEAEMIRIGITHAEVASETKKA